jgi:hypothetical protein
VDLEAVYGWTRLIEWLPCGTEANAAGCPTDGKGPLCAGESVPVLEFNWNPETELSSKFAV